MKKTTFLTSLFLLPSIMLAENEITPDILPDMTIYRISSNTNYMGGMSYNSILFNRQTGEIVNTDMAFGNGNFLSDNGVVVGNTEGGAAAIMINNKTITPESLRKINLCYLSAITPDEKRICGMAINNMSVPYFLAFYCDIDENGKISEPFYLPYPETDLAGLVPQYVTALWISDDGKTILGEVADNYGYYDYPIIFSQDENDSWEYSLPTADLFNPEKLVFPEDPWRDEPPFPNITDFMDPDAREVYEDEMADAINGSAPYPDPLTFLTNEQEEAFFKASETYNNWYSANEKLITEFERIYFKAVEDSYQFPLNGVTLSPNGKILAALAFLLNKESTSSQDYADYFIYGYDLEKNTGKFIKTNSEFILPHQVLDDGTILASYPIFSILSNLPTDSFIISPEWENIISMKEYWQTNNPAYADWADEYLEEGVGFVVTNSDMSMFVGSVEEENYENNLDKLDYLTALAYIFDENKAGVETLPIKDCNKYKVFNLQGVNIVNTTDKNDLMELPSNIYIINGKKVCIKK